MSLLSANNLVKIRQSIKLVTNQFMVTPINYHIASTRFDSWNEDQKEQKFYSLKLMCLVEFDIDDSIVRDSQGAKNKTEVKLTFNLEDLEKLGLITSDYKVKFNQATDYFDLKANLYKVVDIFYDGPLDQKDVLVIVKGEVSKNTNLSFNNFIDNVSQIPVDGNVNKELQDASAGFGKIKVDRWNEDDQTKW